MNYDETLEYIHSLKQFGVKPGLERIRRLMTLLGNPQESLRCVHIAGTNGKGSTAAMLAGVLGRAGYKTGLFVSPFVLDFRERMQIDGRMIGQDELCTIMAEVRAARERVEGEAPNEFETITAAAFLWFARRGCEVVVLEVGLGGRFDATNLIPPPLAAVITAIDLDHTHLLGETVEQIAAEKCGIIKPRTPVVCYPAQSPGALGVIMEHCAQNGATLHMASLNSVQVERCDLSGSDIVVEGQPLHIPLAGRHQVANCLTVLSAVEVLRQRDFALPWAAVKEGIEATRFPARLEILCKNPLVVLDGAHNPAGARTLAAALELLEGRPVTALCGMLADKDWQTSVDTVCAKCSHVVAVQPKNPRALPAGQLAERAAAHCPAAVAGSLREGWRLAKSYGDPVVIWGSLYLAADLRALVLEETAPAPRL